MLARGIPAYDDCMSALLEVRGLSVELPTPRGWARPVNDISLEIAPGETLGLVGESGSGKTMLSLALMGLLPTGARVRGEAFLSADARERAGAVASRKNLVALRENEWQKVRGGEIAMVFQEPMTSLNPVMTVGAQISEAVTAHDSAAHGADLHARVIDALERASVPEPEVRAKQFPHQLSGGLRQRVMIAMALAAGPRLLMADEPTTALDVTVQKQVLGLLDRLRREMRLGMLFITHDLGVVAQVADRVAVMYTGRIVEQGPARDVLTRPAHPYTKGLLAASPTLQRGELQPIQGTVPQLTALPPGCTFAPRCAWRQPECTAHVPDLRVLPGDFAAPNSARAARCILVGGAEEVASQR
jgi:oligopeptide/dipeptide ABC transporter ATP-binding protein